MSFQEAIDLITAVGWDPGSTQAKAINYEVPLVKDLAHRRVDLAASTTERLGEFRQSEPIPPDVMTKITANRNAVAALDHLIGAYTVAIAQRQH